MRITRITGIRSDDVEVSGRRQKWLPERVLSTRKALVPRTTFASSPHRLVVATGGNGKYIQASCQNLTISMPLTPEVLLANLTLPSFQTDPKVMLKGTILLGGYAAGTHLKQKAITLVCTASTRFWGTLSCRRVVMRSSR